MLHVGLKWYSIIFLIQEAGLDIEWFNAAADPGLDGLVSNLESGSNFVGIILNVASASLLGRLTGGRHWLALLGRPPQPINGVIQDGSEPAADPCSTRTYMQPEGPAGDAGSGDPGGSAAGGGQQQFDSHDASQWWNLDSHLQRPQLIDGGASGVRQLISERMKGDGGVHLFIVRRTAALPQ